VGIGVELASIRLMPARSVPKRESMSLRLPGSVPTRRFAVLALALSAVVLGGCGTPAVVKPVATPLPGFKRAIQSAQNVVTQSEQQAYGATSVSGP
jgi:anti-sigma-K factor RskA